MKNTNKHHIYGFIYNRVLYRFISKQLYNSYIARQIAIDIQISTGQKFIFQGTSGRRRFRILGSGNFSLGSNEKDPMGFYPWKIHGKPIGNPWEIHGNPGKIHGKPMEHPQGKSTDSKMNNLFFNNQTEDSLGKCGYLATSTWISNDLTLVTQPKPLKNDSKWGI